MAESSASGRLGKRSSRVSGSSIAKRIALENATVPVRFQGSGDRGKVYHILWTELLQVDSEMPFQEYECVKVGVQVLAPWQQDDCERVQFSEAIVVEEPGKSAAKKSNSGQIKQKGGGKKAKKGPVKSPTKAKQTKSKAKVQVQEITAKEVEMNVLNMIECHESTLECEEGNSQAKCHSESPKESSSKNKKSTEVTPKRTTPKRAAHKRPVPKEKSPKKAKPDTLKQVQCVTAKGVETQLVITTDSQESPSECSTAQNITKDEVTGADVEERNKNFASHISDDLPTTDVDDASFVSNEAYMPTSEGGVTSDMSEPPGHHRRACSNPNTEEYVHVPKLNRRHTYPMSMPTGPYNQYTFYQMDDDDRSSVWTSISEHGKSQLSADLKFVFDEWIIPMRNQLSMMEIMIQSLVTSASPPFSSGHPSHTIPPDTPCYPHGYLHGHHLLTQGYYSNTLSNRPFDLTSPLTSSDPSLLTPTSDSTPKSPANHPLHVSRGHPPPTATASHPSSGRPPPPPTATANHPGSGRPPPPPTATANHPGSGRPPPLPTATANHLGSGRRPPPPTATGSLPGSSHPPTPSQGSHALVTVDHSTPPTTSSHDKCSSVTPHNDSASNGFYIGYPNKEKHRVWVADMSYTEFVVVDKQGGDYEGLATKLLELLFKTELLNPDEYCCTPSKGKEILNQETLRGIRLHLHKKFLIKKSIKIYSDEEEQLWKKCIKKLNAHIRYLRLKKKNN